MADGRKSRSVGVDHRGSGVCHQRVHGQGDPTERERAQDGGEGGDPFRGGRRVRGSHKLTLNGDLLSVPEGDLADLKVQLQDESEDQEEGHGERRRVVFVHRSTDATGALVLQAVPAQDGKQTERHADDPHEHECDVGERHRALCVVRQRVVQRQVTVHGDRQDVEHRCREGCNEEPRRQQRDKSRIDYVSYDEIEDQA